MALRTHKISSKFAVVKALELLSKFGTSSKFWPNFDRMAKSAKVRNFERVPNAHFFHGVVYQITVWTRFVITCSRMDFQNDLEIIRDHRWKSTIYSAVLEAITEANFHVASQAQSATPLWKSSKIWLRKAPRSCGNPQNVESSSATPLWISNRHALVSHPPNFEQFSKFEQILSNLGSLKQNQILTKVVF